MVEQTIDQEHLLYRMTKRIRQSLELPNILSATVAEVREFLGTDRVIIYRFDADESGEVVAESIDQNRLPSLQGLHFPADDIPPQARQMYRTLHQRTIVNVATGEIGLSLVDSPETGEPIIPPEINYRSVDPCHLAYLGAMGVQSSVALPILSHAPESETTNKCSCEINPSPTHLWGLLVSHHSEPHEISPDQLHIVQLIVDKLSISIQQSHLLSSTRQQAIREATINHIASVLHQQPKIQFQAALEAAVSAFQGVGGRLYIFPNADQASEIWTHGTQPTMPQWDKSSLLEEHPLWQQLIHSQFTTDRDDTATSQFAIPNLYKEPRLRVLVPAFQSTSIRGLLVIPIQSRQKLLGTLTIFRDEIETETLWAGQFDPNVKQTLPRQSFELWREFKKGQAKPWTDKDLSLAQEIADQFAMAIQQYLLYQEVKNLNRNLEQQVFERTVKLHKALELAQAVKRVTNKIRSTLDCESILLTVVQEIRALLNTDRVLIYQLNNQSEGQVTVESIRDRIPSILGLKTPEGCFSSDVLNRYRRGEIRAICDIYEEELTPCHREFLESIQVRANLIVPISFNYQIWGFLIAHECQKPRGWTPEEMSLLEQLGSQAAIAIAQANLYEKVCTAAANEQAKSQQLAQTLEELQKTQSQLIQTEKMSGLGRLVAGMAHEINNPVNFIYGNLNYVSEYSQNLINLIQIYQQYYPEPCSEVQEYIASTEVDFILEDLPKVMNSMQIGTERIRQLVLSLRNFSRLDEAQIKTVDIHEGIENTLLLLQYRLREDEDDNDSGIKIVKDYADIPRIECYPGLLNQVYMNIIGNAIDAIESNLKKTQKQAQNAATAEPQIIIRTSIVSSKDPQSNLIQISILDNGPGIRPEHLSRIFDPFFTTKPVGQGTGLGLSISYQIIVEKHHGNLQCISQLNRGSEFRILLPLHQA